MHAWQLFDVETDEAIGEPGDLPAVFGGSGTRLAAEDLARIGALLAEQENDLAGEYEGRGYRLVEVADPPPPIPQAVKPLQMVKALRLAGIRDEVEAYVEAGSEDVKDAYNRASEFRRDSALLNDAGLALYHEEAPARLDALFTLAASIVE